MHNIVAILFLLQAPVAFAANISLVSGPCAGDGAATTGFVISWHQRTFVLASADLVVNSNDPSICHRAGAAQTPLQLLRFDWANGLALFAAPPALDSLGTPLAPHEAKLLDAVHWEGGAGSVMGVGSHRHQFASDFEAYELGGSPTTSVSAGSGVFTSLGEPVALLTNEYLEVVPGHGSRISRWDRRNSAPASQLVAVPVSTVIRWIDQVMPDAWAPTFVVDYREQLRGSHAFSLGPVEFTEYCRQPGQEGERDPAFPIGGGDPTGIGGDSASQPACVFSVTKASSPSPSPLRGPWLARLEAYLAKGSPVSVTLAYARENGSHRLQSQGFASLGGLGRAMQDPRFGFLLALEGANVPHEPKLAPLRKFAQELLSNVESDSDFCFVDTCSSAELARAYLFASLALTDDWRSVTSKDLAGFIAENPGYNDMDSTRGMLAALKALGQ